MQKINNLRILEFLKVVHEAIQNGGKFSIIALCKQYEIPDGVCTALLKSGIIRNIGNKKIPKYEWVNPDIPPNIHMAKRLIVLCRQVWKEKSKKNYHANKTSSKKRSAKIPEHPVQLLTPMQEEWLYILDILNGLSVKRKEVETTEQLIAARFESFEKTYGLNIR